MVGGKDMRKHLFIFAAVVALGAVACNKQAPEAEAPGLAESSRVWNVSFNAVKGADTKALAYDAGNKKILTSFKVTDQVYVYNKTKGALDAGVLKPETDGESVKISGTLTGDYAVGDVVDLRYGSYFAFDGGVFDYEEQDGSFETLRDFGVATVSVTAVDSANGVITLGDANFTNPHSIFRFTFVDDQTGNPIPINMLWIRSPFGKLVLTDAPDGTREYYGPLPDFFPRESFRNDSTDPVWLSICCEAPDDPSMPDGLVFDIEDRVNMIVWDMYKPGDGKITNGKFYAPTINMMALPKPEVTLTSSGAAVQPSQICAVWEMGNYYTYENPGDDITVGGESGDQCRFRWTGSGNKTIRFKGVNTGFPQFFACDNTTFIEQLWGPLTIDLDGNTEAMGAADKALIKVDYGYKEVVFQGKGSLTLIASNTVGTKGFALSDAGGNLRDGAPNVHAASGYSLEVSEALDNGDGTSTWTYTVSPLLQ